MNQNAEAIVILCSRLCVGEGIRPLEAREWSKLAQQLLELDLEPRELLEFSREDFQTRLQYSPEQADRFLRLIDRSASMGFELNRYASMGIQLVTRADQAYPRRLKKKLGNACPPIFYSAGDLELLEDPCAGYVGSREIGQEDLEFTKKAVRKTVAQYYSVVSGGARGVDTAAETEALQCGSVAIVFLADSLARRIRKKDTINAIQEGRLLLLSPVKPEAGFQAGVAMARNKLIYCHSSGTVAVRSDLNKGGTWAGAMECLKHQWSPVFCWNNPAYQGNMGLIEQGAIPIDGGWDGDLTAVPKSKEPEIKAFSGEQLNLFDF